MAAATVIQRRLRARPAHTPGPTYLAYTPDGTRLVTVGSNNAIRVYTTGYDGEPVNVDDCQEGNTAVAASNDFFVTGSEDGMVCLYSLETHSFDKTLVRSSLPIRDVALSPDGNWAAVASDELVVKVVNTHDMTRVQYLRDQPKPVKHLSFHPSGSYLAVSCSDGIIYVYSMTTEEPELVRKVDGLIRALETDVEITSRVAWHPDGRAFAVQTPTREIQVMSRSDWARQRAFTKGHMGDITAISWAPNGALLASAGSDGKVLLWDTSTQKVVAIYEYPNVMSFAWHPTQNIVSFSSTEGEVFIYENFVPSEHLALFQKGPQPAPFIHDPLAEVSANVRRPAADGPKDDDSRRRARRGTPNSLDDILGLSDDDDNDFVIDDDGAGYTNGVNGFGKRTNGHLGDLEGPNGKRMALDSLWRPTLHKSFQPGSTPWRGNRRYLCVNLTGTVWTVDQDIHHTVTVEFYDREYHRDFHFTDPFLYDKACLNDKGALFSCPSHDGNPAMIFYRPHETWTSRADWRTSLPLGEEISAISLSDSYVVVTTSANYVRVFTLFGTPFRVYRQKSSPTVTCASWRDYVLTMGNGAVGGDGKTRLMYTIENVKRDRVCQSEDVVALAEGTEVKNVFFSEDGDPCIYDSTGVLLMLLHWREPGQARWVPVLNTKALDRLAGGRKEESYWPVAVAQDKFHCIILKGGDQYPYFPRPLLSEFDFKVPLSDPPAPSKPKGKATDGDGDGNGDDDDDDDNDNEDNNNNSSNSNSISSPANEIAKLEESFVRNTLFLSLLQDQTTTTKTTTTNKRHSQRAELARRELDVDKILLQLLAAECRDGEERGMKALEIVGLMRDRSGKMVEAAGKVAGRFGRRVLEEKIRELAERRLLGEDEDDADDDEHIDME
ncbi:MAG: hypothetical protein M1837_004301 [Sclerophora amabilis]|nr:MAG: hypothetical protein M1837_004301 [Sclerophora amabilis]